MRAILLLLIGSVAVCSAQRGPNKAQAEDFRIVKGKLYNSLASEEWVMVPSTTLRSYFTTKVVDVEKNGVVVEAYWTEGRYTGGNGFNRAPTYVGSQRVDMGRFFIANYPGFSKLVTGEIVQPVRAFPIGSVKYGGETIKAYDCGLPATTENRTKFGLPTGPSAEQVAAAQKKQIEKDAARKDAEIRTLNFQLEQADKGYPSAQYSLGMRYLKGDGVEKDPAKARMWLEKAAAQDYAEAKAALSKMAAPTDAPPASK